MRLLTALLIAAALSTGAGAHGQPKHAAASPAPAPPALPPVPYPVENQWRQGTFNKMNWGPENLHALPWLARNVTVAPDGAVHIVANRFGEAGVKTGSSWNGGVIEYDATFPAKIPSGTDVASGYLYANGDELNFPEVLQDGRPRFAIHADGRQIVKVLDTDVRGQRHTFGAIWKAAEFVTFTMDGKPVWTVKASALPRELGRLPSAPMAFVSNITFFAGLPDWAGRYTPLRGRAEVRLVLHGFRYTQF